MVGSQQAATSSPRSPLPDHTVAVKTNDDVEESVESKQDTGIETMTASTSSNKFFIVKSLTLQDLELSVRNGIWATQSHNEDVLNKAFRVSTNRRCFLVNFANEPSQQKMSTLYSPPTNLVNTSATPA